MKTVLDNLKGKLVVSCQALENEPLHSPFIMSRMALAAAQGGAAAIRANSVVDIEAIKQQVSLPVIGIIKRDYPESEVFITATMKEVDELMASRRKSLRLMRRRGHVPAENLWKRWSRASARVIPRCC
jgi:N-acylglucosamine-6-phosphate 2-epimerase